MGGGTNLCIMSATKSSLYDLSKLQCIDQNLIIYY